MEKVLIIHIFTTIFMTGLCWFVQIVHYPLFHQINLKDFPRYERKNAVTGFITVPIMVIELLTGLYLLYLNQDFLYFTNVALLGIIGLSTALLQVPMHLKLMNTASHELISKVTNTNWIRTISWTVRSGILMVVLYGLLK